MRVIIIPSGNWARIPLQGIEFCSWKWQKTLLIGENHTDRESRIHVTSQVPQCKLVTDKVDGIE